MPLELHDAWPEPPTQVVEQAPPSPVVSARVVKEAGTASRSPADSFDVEHYAILDALQDMKEEQNRRMTACTVIIAVLLLCVMHSLEGVRAELRRRT